MRAIGCFSSAYCHFACVSSSCSPTSARQTSSSTVLLGKSRVSAFCSRASTPSASESEPSSRLLSLVSFSSRTVLVSSQLSSDAVASKCLCTSLYSSGERFCVGIGEPCEFAFSQWMGVL
eukprot:1118982-Rhodomonas_salina.3